ncbi:MAG: phosphatidylserine decarboxylase [Deltaproteobacteria bacterium]|nr:phosphatidylserine decarboxylase [Deltaproteobacteria bacterium]
MDAGQRFGLIRFGSRLEVYLPEDSQITAQPGQKVKAGETIIGYLS